MVKNVHSKKCPGVHFPVKILQQKILHLFVVVFLIKILDKGPGKAASSVRRLRYLKRTDKFSIRRISSEGHFSDV
jgi:hypothetical protein